MYKKFLGSQDLNLQPKQHQSRYLMPIEQHSKAYVDTRN